MPANRSGHHYNTNIITTWTSLQHKHHYNINIITTQTSLQHEHHYNTNIITTQTSLQHEHHYNTNIITTQTSLQHKHHYNMNIITTQTSSSVLCYLHPPCCSCHIAVHIPMVGVRTAQTACCSLRPTVCRQSLFVFRSVHRSWTVCAVLCPTIIRLACCKGFPLTPYELSVIA